MSAAQENPFAQAVANGVTTAFSFNFTLLDEGDLVVVGELNGSLTSYSVNVDFTLTGIGTSTGTATFLSAPANGTVLSFRRAIALQRDNDYQTSGDLDAETLDLDFDRIWYAMQDVERWASSGFASSLRVPSMESVPELPTAVNRALKLLGFNASGDPVAIPNATGDASALALLLASSSLASQGAGMVAYDSARTYAAGTVGKALSQASGNSIPVTSFGAVGDGVTDCAAAFESAFAEATATGAGRVYIRPGTYYFSRAVSVPSNIELFGEGSGSIIKLAPGIAGFDVNAKTGVVIRRIRITSTAYNSTSAVGGIRLTSCTDCVVSNVLMDRLSCGGVYMQSSSRCTVTLCVFTNWYGATGLGTLGIQDSADICMFGDSQHNYVAGNFCMSSNDIGISIQNRYTQSSPIGNTVHANYCYNQNAYGILVYNGCWNPATDGPTYALNPPMDMKTAVTANHVWGVKGTQIGGLTGAGIYLQSAGGTTCSDNHVWDCCKNTTNFDTQAIGHITAVVGAYTYGELHSIVLANNRINAPQGVGLWIATSSVPVIASNNSIRVTSTSSSGRQNAIRVTNAIAKLRGFDIRTENTTFEAVSINATGAAFDGIEVAGSVHTAGYGVAFNASSGGSFKGVDVHNLLVRGGTTTALQLADCAGARVSHCDLESTGVVLSVTNVTQGKLSNNRAYSSSGGASISFSGTNTGSTCDETNELAGVVLNTAGNGMLITQWGDASPASSGTWAANDRVLRKTATAGSWTARRCTAPGNPGTWSDEGTLGGGGAITNADLGTYTAETPSTIVSVLFVSGSHYAQNNGGFVSGFGAFQFQAAGSAGSIAQWSVNAPFATGWSAAWSDLCVGLWSAEDGSCHGQIIKKPGSADKLLFTCVTTAAVISGTRTCRFTYHYRAF